MIENQIKALAVTKLAALSSSDHSKNYSASPESSIGNESKEKNDVQVEDDDEAEEEKGKEQGKDKAKTKQEYRVTITIQFTIFCLATILLSSHLLHVIQLKEQLVLLSSEDAISQAEEEGKNASLLAGKLLEKIFTIPQIMEGVATSKRPGDKTVLDQHKIKLIISKLYSILLILVKDLITKTIFVKDYVKCNYAKDTASITAYLGTKIRNVRQKNK